MTRKRCEFLMVNQELTTKEIVEKDFSTKMRGYDPDEVDEYLDAVIRDYDSFITEINSLRDQNTRLEDKIERIEKERDTAFENQSNVTSAPLASSERVEETNQGATNFDILKRLSNLEREVFGSKLSRDN